MNRLAKNNFKMNAQTTHPGHVREPEPKFCACGGKALFKVGNKGFCYDCREKAQKAAKLEPPRIGFIPE